MTPSRLPQDLELVVISRQKKKFPQQCDAYYSVQDQKVINLSDGPYVILPTASLSLTSSNFAMRIHSLHEEARKQKSEQNSSVLVTVRRAVIEKGVTEVWTKLFSFWSLCGVLLLQRVYLKKLLFLSDNAYILQCANETNNIATLFI